MTATLRELLELPELVNVQVGLLASEETAVAGVELSVSVPDQFRPAIVYCIPWPHSFYDPALDNLIRRAYRDRVAALLLVQPVAADPNLVYPTHLVDMSRRLGINLLFCFEMHFSEVWSAITARLTSDELTVLKRWQHSVSRLSSAAVKSVSVDDFVHQAEQILACELQWNAQASADVASAAAIVNGSVIGHLNHTDYSDDPGLLRVTSQLAAAVHLADVSKSQARAHRHSDLLQIVLNERTDRETILKTAHRAKLDANGVSWVISLSARAQSEDGQPSLIWDSLLEDIRQQLESQHIACLSGYYAGYPTLIVQDKPGLRGSEEVEHWLDTSVGALLPGHVIAGVSNPQQMGTGLAEGFKEAMEAAVVGRALEKPEMLVHSTDLGRDRLFYALLTSPFAQWVTRAMLQPIVDSDNAHDTDYLRTLTAYMQNDRKLLETARTLNLHRNSLRYRLSNIERLTGVRMDDPEHAFLLQLAVLTHRARGFTAPLSLDSQASHW